MADQRVDRRRDEWFFRRTFMAEGSDDQVFTLEDGTWRRIVGRWLGGEERVHRDYASGSGLTVRFGDGEFGRLPDQGRCSRRSTGSAPALQPTCLPDRSAPWKCRASRAPWQAARLGFESVAGDERSRPRKRLKRSNCSRRRPTSQRPSSPCDPRTTERKLRSCRSCRRRRERFDGRARGSP